MLNKKSPQYIFIEKKGDPLVHLEIALKSGTIKDPLGKEGLASMTLSMLLRGTKKYSSKEFHERLDFLGGEIHLSKFKESLRIHVVSLLDKLDDMLELVRSMLVEPAFSKEEFKKIQTQLKTALEDELGSDDEISERRFQEYLLAGSKYSRASSGSIQSIKKIKQTDLVSFHKNFFSSPDFVVGAIGGFNSNELKKKLNQIFSSLKQKPASALQVSQPKILPGRNLLLLNKKGGSQTQVYLGSTGVHFTDADYFPILIANHVFGGSSFSARMMTEIREKRGWSYGAYSWYRSGKKPLYFGMHFVPSNQDTGDAVALAIQLYEDYAKNGITKEEFAFAKDSLMNQSAFMQDTARKKLDNLVTEAVVGLPKNYYENYRNRLKKITYTQVQKAIQRKVDKKRLFVFVLGDAAKLKKAITEKSKFKKVWIKDFAKQP
ncbi:MAG: insulinase family protein [Oligoflexia bacterium]|nr:insulinase family protein [Oligoflexia bacterium]